jgi:hypothetical protein
MDEAMATARAKYAWSLMTDNEKAIVRFGMTPIWVLREGFEGRDPKRTFTNVELNGVHCRLISLALMACAAEDGGMVC